MVNTVEHLHRIVLVSLWVWRSRHVFLAIRQKSLSEIVHFVDWHRDDSSQNYLERTNRREWIHNSLPSPRTLKAGHLPSRYAVAGHTTAFAIIFIAKFTAARSCGRCRCRGICVIWRCMMRWVWMIVMMMCCRGRQIKRIQVWICIPGFRVKTYFSFSFSIICLHYEDSVYTMRSRTNQRKNKKKKHRKEERKNWNWSTYWGVGNKNGYWHVML